MLHCTYKFKKHGFCINSDHLPISMVNMNYYTSIIKSKQAVLKTFRIKEENDIFPSAQVDAMSYKM